MAKYENLHYEDQFRLPWGLMQLTTRTHRFGLTERYMATDMDHNATRTNQEFPSSSQKENFDVMVVGGRLLLKLDFAAPRPTLEQWRVTKIESSAEGLSQITGFTNSVAEIDDCRISAWSREWRVPIICHHTSTVRLRRNSSIHDAWNMSLIHELYDDITTEERKSYSYTLSLYRYTQRPTEFFFSLESSHAEQHLYILKVTRQIDLGVGLCATSPEYQALKNGQVRI